MTVRVRTESELLHRHGLNACPGYYVVEEKERVVGRPGQADHEPVPDILDGPYVCQSMADHVAETRFGMTREAG